MEWGISHRRCLGPLASTCAAQGKPLSAGWLTFVSLINKLTVKEKKERKRRTHIENKTVKISACLHFNSTDGMEGAVTGVWESLLKMRGMYSAFICRVCTDYILPTVERGHEGCNDIRTYTSVRVCLLLTPSQRNVKRIHLPSVVI